MWGENKAQVKVRKARSDEAGKRQWRRARPKRKRAKVASQVQKRCRDHQSEENLHSNTQPSALERTTPNVPDHLEWESSEERRLRRVQSDVAGWDQLDLMKPEGQTPFAEKFSSSTIVRSHCVPANPGWHWHSFVCSAGGKMKERRR